MKEKFSRHFHGGKRKKGDAAKFAAQLAPLEELDKSVAAKQVESSPTGDPQAESHHGAIVVDNDRLNLPRDIMEERAEGTLWRMEPVVIVILGVMLLFIAFIAWQISLMPVE